MSELWRQFLNPVSGNLSGSWKEYHPSGENKDFFPYFRFKTLFNFLQKCNYHSFNGTQIVVRITNYTFFFFHFYTRNFCNHQQFGDRKKSLWCGIYNTTQTINIVYTLVFCLIETRAALDNQEVQHDRNQRGKNNNDQVCKQSVAVYG